MVKEPVCRNQCNHCQVVVASKNEMEEHMSEQHPGGQEYWCDQCNYTFHTEKLLGGHNRKYHASQGTKKMKNLVKEEMKQANLM